MIVLAFDTATSATVVGAQREPGGPVAERAHRPAPGERPGHVAQLMLLARDALAGLGLRPADVERVGVGIGPGTFTGLRIGLATAHALAGAAGAELVGVSTLEALADEARRSLPGEDVLAVLDARRGEAFAAAWSASGDVLAAPQVLVPEALAPLAAGRTAVGDGAVRFRSILQPAGAEVPEDGSALHEVAAGALCRLARAGRPEAVADVLPAYLRAPDATPRRT